MTDFTDDELVSAVLDGEATDAEAARVHADAGLSARLAELRAARDAIAAPMTLPTGEQRDAAIAAAATSAAAAGTAQLVVDLRDRRRRRALRVASIAAALLVAVGIVSAVAALSGRHSDKASSTAAGQAPLSSASPPPSPAAAEGTTASTSLDTNRAAAAPDGLELGSFQTPQELVDTVKARAADSSTRQNQGGLSVCASRPDATFVGRASLAGQPVIVIVSGGAGQQTIEVEDLNCAVVLSQPL